MKCKWCEGKRVRLREMTKRNAQYVYVCLRCDGEIPALKAKA